MHLWDEPAGMPRPLHFTLKGLEEKDFKETEYVEVEGKFTLLPVSESSFTHQSALPWE